MMIKKAVLLDTSFFIRLLKLDDPLYENANGYYHYFLLNNFEMLISTISIAEFCTYGDFEDLPLKDLRVISFDIDHALRTAEFAKIAFQARKDQNLIVDNRKIIPNDTKLFAQADCLENVEFYLSSDSKSHSVYSTIRTETNPKFRFLDLVNPHNDTFGMLPL